MKYHKHMSVHSYTEFILMFFISGTLKQLHVYLLMTCNNLTRICVKHIYFFKSWKETFCFRSYLTLSFSNFSISRINIFFSVFIVIVFMQYLGNYLAFSFQVPNIFFITRTIKGKKLHEMFCSIRSHKAYA